MKKNDLLEIKIETMGNAGEGIGKIDGYPLFVKDALPGDTARVRLTKVKKTYAYARLEELLEASPYRTKPRCPLHRSCGGCQIQALSYEKQLEYKENKVRQDLIRIGGFSDPPVLPVLGMEEPYHYRNKAQFPFGRDREGRIVTGFYAGRTHTIVPGTDCAIGVPENKEILETILDFMKEKGVEPYDETTGKGLLRHALLRKAFATGELMVCLVINGRRFPYVEELADRLFAIPGMTSFSLNVNQKNTNVILGEEVIPVRGQTYITDQIGGIRYQISPLSFYQVNPAQTEKLYRTALEYAGLTGGETVWELYCGIGTISLFLAKSAGQVYGVEIVPDVSVRQGYEKAKAVWQAGGFDGLFCTADALAVGACNALRAEGVEIPGQVKLVGYDDTAIAHYGAVPLTSVHQSTEEIGRLAADTLLQIIDGKQPERRHITLPVHLVVRASTGRQFEEA